MLAIHNVSLSKLNTRLVANAYAKLSKCQQFTTGVRTLIRLRKLQTLMQSYQNVSNSQLFYHIPNFFIGCKRFCKVIKMLAIHNFVTANFFKIWLQTLMQSYQNVSNSQLAETSLLLTLSCKRFCKVIKMLAIHNYLFFINII